MTQEFYIAESKLYDECDDDGNECLITSYKPNISNLKHGDLIIFNESGKYEGRYRNEGVYIWNATDNYIQNLEYEIDDYGHIPSNFKVGKDFLPNHWNNVIDHNDIIHLDNELYENVDLKYDNNKYIAQINIQNQLYDLIISYNCDKPSLKDIKDFLCTYPHVYFCEDSFLLYCKYFKK